jgi:hypothetical protein
MEGRKVTFSMTEQFVDTHLFQLKTRPLSLSFVKAINLFFHLTFCCGQIS